MPRFFLNMLYSGGVCSEDFDFFADFLAAFFAAGFFKVAGSAPLPVVPLNHVHQFNSAGTCLPERKAF